jgi:hypothetical protein
MLTNIENYSWLIILPVFGLLFTKIWDALKRHSSCSETASFVIALCVSMLCVISIIGFFPHEPGTSQEIATVSKEDTSSQEPHQHEIRFILLPYMALMMSFLLLLMIVEIGLLAESVDRPPGHQDKEGIMKKSNKNIRKQPDKRKGYLR